MSVDSFHKSLNHFLTKTHRSDYAHEKSNTQNTVDNWTAFTWIKSLKRTIPGKTQIDRHCKSAWITFVTTCCSFTPSTGSLAIFKICFPSSPLRKKKSHGHVPQGKAGIHRQRPTVRLFVLKCSYKSACP